jgi:prophage regulatory protein
MSIDEPGDPHRMPPQPRHPLDNLTSLKRPDAALERKTSGPRLDLKRVIRRRELRQLVPLGDTTIYEMEQRGEFPKRFYLTPRCAAWDLGAVEGWIEERKHASEAQRIQRTPRPDVRRRKNRPVRR